MVNSYEQITQLNKKRKREEKMGNEKVELLERLADNLENISDGINTLRTYDHSKDSFEKLYDSFRETVIKEHIEPYIEEVNSLCDELGLPKILYEKYY